MNLPEKTDVLVVGGGPAGMMASLCLTTYGIDTLHVDERSEPTTAGRADGIQPRTLEVLRNIGGVLAEDEPGDAAIGSAPLVGDDIAKRMIKQGVRVYQVAFWDPTPTEKLARTSRAASCPDFIDVCDNFTLLLHQGRIEKTFLNETNERRKRLLGVHEASKTPWGGLYRPWFFITTRVLEATPNDPLSDTHPIETVLEHVDTKERKVVRSKYLFGSDGAKSLVRRAIAGGEVGDGEWQGKITMQGEGTDIVWGVIDAQVSTDFPDIKYKCLLHSRDAGSIMVIPREHGLCRFYVQLKSTEIGSEAHVSRDKATEEICIAHAKKIFEPYKVEFGYVDWFSVYQIGQRIASKYTLDHRIFLGGDATHTHSPKAGQGMNISFLDAHNWAWKVNLIEKGLGDPSILLPSYEFERRGVAEMLLAFDSEYSKLFSGNNPKQAQLTDQSSKAVEEDKPLVDPEKFIQVFKANAEFTSGCGAIYKANSLNALGEKYGQVPFNPSGNKLTAGQRLLPARVTRVMDANQVRLQQEVKMNGAFRIHVFAGNLSSTKAKLEAFDNYLESSESFVNKHRPSKDVRCSIIDGHRAATTDLETQAFLRQRNPFFTFLTIVGTPTDHWEIRDLPRMFRAARDQVYVDELFDRRVPVAADQMPIHVKYGINKDKGGIVVVRPDGYVGATTKLDEQGWKGITEYFGRFLLRTDEPKRRL